MCDDDNILLYFSFDSYLILDCCPHLFFNVNGDNNYNYQPALTAHNQGEKRQKDTDTAVDPRVSCSRKTA